MFVIENGELEQERAWKKDFLMKHDAIEAHLD